MAESNDACGPERGRPFGPESERSDAGIPVERYPSADGRPFTPAIGDEALLEALGAHVEHHFGACAGVIQEIVSDIVRVDIMVVAPTVARPFWTLVTCGMSQRPMWAAAGSEECEFAELVIRLPPNWPIGQESLRDDKWWWPIRMMKYLARFPHEYSTWLWAWHTIANGDPPSAFAEGTGLAGAMLVPLSPPGEEARRLVLADRSIHLFGVAFLHADEVSVRLDRGPDALRDLFDDGELSELVDPDRLSVVQRQARD